MWPYDCTDFYNPPTKWFMPVWGNGLLTTGTIDPPVDGHVSIPNCGKVFGYCFLPEIFVLGGSASSSEHGWNPELQDEQFHTSKWGCHPLLATQVEAVEWLKSRGLFGQVMRYAHHQPLDERGPIWDYDILCPTDRRQDKWKQYQPWITAGVVAQVTDTKG